MVTNINIQKQDEKYFWTFKLDYMFEEVVSKKTYKSAKTCMRAVLNEIKEIGEQIPFAVMPFVRTWCDYLVPCPHRNPSEDPASVFVGDYGCFTCPFCCGHTSYGDFCLCGYSHHSDER